MGIRFEERSASMKVIPGSKIQLHSQTSIADLSFGDGPSSACVGFIDLVNSTRITARLSSQEMRKYYSHFINWASDGIRDFGGMKVKNTGDGVLFFFPLAADSEVSRTISDCLRCSIAMTLLHPYINAKFRSESLPELNYRVSLDYGEISLATTPDSRAVDIFGTTVNACAKINRIAAPNTVVVGGDFYQVAKSLGTHKFRATKRTISIADRQYPTFFVSESDSVASYFSSNEYVNSFLSGHGLGIREYAEEEV